MLEEITTIASLSGEDPQPTEENGSFETLINKNKNSQSLPTLKKALKTDQVDEQSGISDESLGSSRIWSSISLRHQKNSKTNSQHNTAKRKIPDHHHHHHHHHHRIICSYHRNCKTRRLDSLQESLLRWPINRTNERVLKEPRESMVQIFSTKQPLDTPI